MTAPVSRRTVVRTTAHAAWLTPVVTVAAAVPAFAASGPAAVSVTNVTATRAPSVVPPGFSPIVSITTNLANSNTQRTVGLKVSLSITLPPTASFTDPPIVTNINGYDMPAGTVVDRTVTFVFTAREQLEGASGAVPTTKPFSPSVDLKVDSSGTVTITPVVQGDGTASSGTGVFA